MVTVAEFDAMSQVERQQTIQNLMGSDPTNAQILMIRQQELAGQNTANPTVANPTQAAQIREAQAHNTQVYQEQQVKQASEIKQAAVSNQVNDFARTSPVGSVMPYNPETVIVPSQSGQTAYVRSDYDSKIVTTPVRQAPAVTGVMPSNPDTWSKQAVVGEAKTVVATPKPTIVKQSDLGIGEQTFIAVDTGIKVLKSINKDNPLAQAEIDYGISPLMYGEAGFIGSLEANIYGAAGLAGSVVKSVENKKLTIVQGFEGFNPEAKTPILSPTHVSSGIGAVLGNPNEAKTLGERPLAYQVGSGFGEVSLAVVSGEAVGVVGGKTATYVRTVINPRVNAAGESVLARSTKLFESTANKVQPGLGKTAETVVKRDAAVLGAKLDLVESKASAAVAAKIVNPIKSKVAEPVVNTATNIKNNVVTVGQRASDIVMPQGSNEGAVFMRAVVEPNLTNYSKITNINTKVNAVKSAIPTIDTGEIKGAASFLRQSDLLPTATKATTKTGEYNPLKGTVGFMRQSDFLPTPKTAKPTNVKTGSRIIQYGAEQQVITKPKTVATTSTKNINDFDALMMAKKVSKQGKRLTQITPVERTASTPQVAKTVTVTKNAVATVEPATTKATGVSSVLASGVAKSTVQPYPGTQKTRFIEETTYYTQPGEVQRLDKPTGTSLIPLTDSTIRVNISPENRMPNDSFIKNVTQETVMHPVDQTFKPIDAVQNFPVVIQKQEPVQKPVYDALSSQKSGLKYDLSLGFKLEGRGVKARSMRGGVKTGSLRRVYPIASAADMLSTNTLKSKSKRGTSKSAKKNRR